MCRAADNVSGSGELVTAVLVVPATTHNERCRPEKRHVHLTCDPPPPPLCMLVDLKFDNVNHGS
jgi:hypothetical protein